MSTTAVGDRDGEFQRDAAGDLPVGKLAANASCARHRDRRRMLPVRRVEDERRVELRKIEIAHVERPRARGRARAPAECGRVPVACPPSSKLGGEVGRASIASSRHAKRGRRACAAASGRQSIGPAARWSRSSVPASPPPPAARAASTARRVAGSAGSHRARSTSRASTARSTSGTAASGARLAFATMRPVAGAAIEFDRECLERPFGQDIDVRILRRRVAVQREAPVDRERRVARRAWRRRRASRPPSPPRDLERRWMASPPAYPNARSRAEPRLVADLPLEFSDRRTLDRHFDRQGEARRCRHRALRWLEGDRQFACAERLHRDRARQERCGPPRQRDVGCHDRRRRFRAR